LKQASNWRLKLAMCDLGASNWAASFLGAGAPKEAASSKLGIYFRTVWPIAALTASSEESSMAFFRADTSAAVSAGEVPNKTFRASSADFDPYRLE
jgi:hypothetical protein